MRQDEIGRFLSEAAGKVAVEWTHEGVSWRVTVAHTHGDVVAIAVWCDQAGYVRYREELARDFLRELRISPSEPILSRVRRALGDLQRRFQRWVERDRSE